MPTAVLVTGPEGAELLPLGFLLVQYLQCTDRRGAGTDADPRVSCGACDACRASAALSHPDVHFAFPVVGTGEVSNAHLPAWREAVLADPYLSQSRWLRTQTTDNKQGNINREEVMQILHHTSLQRFTDGFKVVLVWGADYLGEESNRLLKLIEEPPGGTVIVLLTHRPDRILPTIASRCRRYRLPHAPVGAISEFLVRSTGLDADRATEIAYATAGDISLALRTAGDAAGGADGEALGPDLAGWLRTCFGGTGAGITQSAAELAKLTREQQKYFLLRALRFVRELGVARAGTPTPLRLAPAEADVAQKLVRLLDWPQLSALAEEVNGLLAAVERNANGKIAFAASSIRIHRILAGDRASATAG